MLFFNIKINEWKDLNNNILRDENIPNRLKEKLNTKLTDIYKDLLILDDEVKSLVIFNKKTFLPILEIQKNKSNIEKDFCLYTSL
jgi:hypothetical protein